MRRRRYLAPLHRKVLDGNELQQEGEVAREALAALEGKAAIYHCVSRVVNREFLLKPLDERLLGHLGLIYDDAQVAQLRWELGHYREQANKTAAEEFRAKYFARMWDPSQDLKIVKQMFTQWFNRKHGRRGVLWEGLPLPPHLELLGVSFHPAWTI